MPTEIIHAAAIVPLRNDNRLLARKPKEEKPVEKTLGQLEDEMIRAFGTEDGERTRIAVLLRMGIRVSR